MILGFFFNKNFINLEWFLGSRERRDLWCSDKSEKACGAGHAYLNPMRHCLNLTVRGQVHVRKILFDGKKAIGVEAESGGEIFTVGAGRVVLSSGAIRSPQLLMLSGIGPKEQLEQFGIPQIHLGKHLVCKWCCWFKLWSGTWTRSRFYLLPTRSRNSWCSMWCLFA